MDQTLVSPAVENYLKAIYLLQAQDRQAGSHKQGR